MAVINTGMVPKALSGGGRFRRSRCASHNDGGPAYHRDDQANAYGPPISNASDTSSGSTTWTPIEDVIGRVDRLRQKAETTFR